MKNQNTNYENRNQNQAVIFEPIAPHPEPVVIGDLLTEIEAVIKRHVVLSDSAAAALAVWVLHTYGGVSPRIVTISGNNDEPMKNPTLRMVGPPPSTPFEI